MNIFSIGMETNHHIKNYMNYHKKYTDKYGENTVILMQTGSNFNLFSIINDEISIGPDIYYICQTVLNNSLQVTKQNKKKSLNKLFRKKENIY